MKTRIRIHGAFESVIATILGLIAVFPIYYMVAGAFFSVSEFSSYPPTLFPSSLKFSNFARALSESMISRFMVNSLITASIGAVLRITVAVLCAFPAAFLIFRGRDALFIFVLATMLLPSDALIIENYLTISSLGLIDTYAGIMSIHLLAPVQIFLLRQAFKSIPRAYKEVAALDGCNDIQFLSRIVLPLTRQIVFVLFLQSFTSIWNAYLWPLLITNDSRMRTVQVGITMLNYAENLDFGPVFAAITLVVLPSIGIFLIFRKKIVDGIAAAVLS